jgi:hypothetical protein
MAGVAGLCPGLTRARSVVAVLPVRDERVGRREGAGDVVVQPVEPDEGPERVAERGLGVGQRHPVLRPLRAGQGGTTVDRSSVSSSE